MSSSTAFLAGWPGSTICTPPRAAWPAVDLPLDRFVAALALRAPRDREPIVALRALVPADLYLATACAAIKISS